MKINAFVTKLMKTMLPVLALVLAANPAFAEEDMTWDKTLKLSDKVIHEKVSYPNRYGITLSADMYMPKDIDKPKKYPAPTVPVTRAFTAFPKKRARPEDRAL